MKRYKLKELKDLPVLAIGQVADLKIDTSSTRVWLHRTDISDGESYNNNVTVEEFINDRWEITDQYPAI